MEFPCNSSALFKPNVFSPDAFLLLLPRLNFHCRSVPSSNRTLLQEWLVTKQEPPVQPIFTKNPRLDFKRSILGNSVLAYKSHPLQVVAVNYPTDYVLGPIFIERQTGVLEGDTIGVNPLAVRLQHNDQLGNEINQLLKFLIHRVKFARGFVEDRSEVGEFIASSNGNPVLKGPPCESLGAFYQAAERNRNAPSRGVGQQGRDHQSQDRGQ